MRRSTSAYRKCPQLSQVQLLACSRCEFIQRYAMCTKYWYLGFCGIHICPGLDWCDRAIDNSERCRDEDVHDIGRINDSRPCQVCERRARHRRVRLNAQASDDEAESSPDYSRDVNFPWLNAHGTSSSDSDESLFAVRYRRSQRVDGSDVIWIERYDTDNGALSNRSATRETEASPEQPNIPVDRESREHMNGYQTQSSRAESADEERSQPIQVIRTSAAEHRRQTSLNRETRRREYVGWYMSTRERPTRPAEGDPGRDRWID